MSDNKKLSRSPRSVLLPLERRPKPTDPAAPELLHIHDDDPEAINFMTPYEHLMDDVESSEAENPTDSAEPKQSNVSAEVVSSFASSQAHGVYKHSLMASTSEVADAMPDQVSDGPVAAADITQVIPSSLTCPLDDGYYATLLREARSSLPGDLKNIFASYDETSTDAIFEAMLEAASAVSPLADIVIYIPSSPPPSPANMTDDKKSVVKDCKDSCRVGENSGTKEQEDLKIVFESQERLVPKKDSPKKPVLKLDQTTCNVIQNIGSLHQENMALLQSPHMHNRQLATEQTLMKRVMLNPSNPRLHPYNMPARMPRETTFQELQHLYQQNSHPEESFHTFSSGIGMSAPEQQQLREGHNRNQQSSQLAFTSLGHQSNPQIASAAGSCLSTVPPHPLTHYYPTQQAHFLTQHANYGVAGQLNWPIAQVSGTAQAQQNAQVPLLTPPITHPNPHMAWNNYGYARNSLQPQVTFRHNLPIASAHPNYPYNHCNC